MSLSVRGLDDICRLCAIESESGVPIYSPEGDNLSLEQKIITCLHIEVSRNDLLPKKVCSACNAQLEELHQFTCRAANAQQTLSFLFDLQLRQLQEHDFGLLQGVKLEGNLIKNELDELAGHQTDLHVAQIENVRSSSEDLNFSQLLPEQPQTIQRPLPVFQPRDFAKEKIDVVDVYSTVAVLDGKGKEGAVLADEEPRQSHRRKMLQPKRTAGADRQEKLELEDAGLELGREVELEEAGLELGRQVALTEQEVTLDGDSADIECLMDSGARDHFKDFSETDLFQGLDEEEEAGGGLCEDKISLVPNNTTRDWAIACATCRDVFPLRADFEAHCRDAHGEKPLYTCSQCAKAFLNFLSYRSHYYRHQCKYSCLYCDKVFTLEGMLRVHVLSRHVTVRPFICEACGKGYVTQHRLDLHRKQHEDVQKEFRCLQCNKVLQTRNGLSAHMTVHRFGRRFQCHLCGKTFTQKVNMQQHVKYHKGERPFPCDQCNKRFAEKSHLKRHKSFHTLERPFQCPVCQKMYKTERCLKVHSQVHEDTRPYVCSECGKGFLNVTKLKQHFHCHTGERPYACKYCERTFTNYPNWLKHTRRRHKVDHKTGVKLKEEDGVNCPPPLLPHSDSLQSIDLLDMADVKVKEDGLLAGAGPNAVMHSMTQSILTQFHVAADSTDLSQFQIPYVDHSHMLPL